MIRRLVLLAILGGTLLFAGPAAAAAPNYILVSGRALSHPVLLDDWQQNLKLMLAVANAPRAHGRLAANLHARPRFDLAEFWAWAGRTRPTTPAHASQHGSFYPAHGSEPAVIVLQVQGVIVPRLAPPSVLKVLTARGVPVRM